MTSLVPVFTALCLLFATPGHGAFYTNTIQSFSFNPPTRTIASGDTVVWINLDGVGHTVTGDFEEEPNCGSGFLYQGGVCMRTFNTGGDLHYKTNIGGPHWFALTIQSNRLMNGALETFCGLPTGDFVFIRIRAAR